METTNHVFNFPFAAIVLIPTIGQEAIEAIYDLRWMLITILVLMVIDTCYAYAEHVKDEHTGKKVTQWSSSGALRRFGGKMGTYLSFLIIGCLIGLAFTEPTGYCSHIVTSAYGASLAIVCEVLSVCGHYLHLRNIYVTLSPTKVIRSAIIAYCKAKNPTIGETLEKELHITEQKDEEKEV